MQDNPICKFCLDSNNLRRDPLIEPCDCRGSLQFVHEQCLTRWRRINPTRNADNCPLCLEPYRLAIGEILEHLPDETRLITFFLRYPFLLCCSVNYLAALQYSFIPHGNTLFFIEYYQYIFQLLYFILFIIIWKVKNKKLYWKQWNSFLVFAMIGIHLMANYHIHTHDFLAIVPINIALGFYYQKHKSVLLKLNEP